MKETNFINNEILSCIAFFVMFSSLLCTFVFIVIGERKHKHITGGYIKKIKYLAWMSKNVSVNIFITSFISPFFFKFKVMWWYFLSLFYMAKKSLQNMIAALYYTMDVLDDLAAEGIIKGASEKAQFRIKTKNMIATGGAVLLTSWAIKSFFFNL